MRASTVWLIPLFSVLGGCLSSQTAYRAAVAQGEAGDGVRACAAQCMSAGEDHADRCLDQCPGFVAYPGDACSPGSEQAGTLCLTVETRVAPDLAFWGGVAEAAAEGAAKGDRDSDDGSSSSAGESSASSSGTDSANHSRKRSATSHVPATVHAGKSAARSKGRRRD